MTTPKSNRLIVIFAGLAAFTALLVFGTNYLLKRLPASPPPGATTLPPPEVDINIEAPEDGESSRPVFKIQKGAVDRRAITYRQAGFKPQRITIQAGDDIGCLITVVNQSGSILRLGVGPHSADGDPGADYGLIAPGAAGVLDVRYSGLTEITIHNHLRPEHEFSVSYGPGCM